jgi:predicted dehydrogenase
MMNKEELSDLNRREFLKGGSFATLMALLGAVELRAQDQPKAASGTTEYKTIGNPVNCGVIGCGAWGREILKNLARLPNAPVIAICDTYEAYLRRAAESAPKAEKYTDYRKVLENKQVQAVLVATPSHLHREIVIEALKAGKHVYCEAPLATTIEDARAIASAAKAALKQNFQAGLQTRSDPQRHFLLSFVRTGAMGRNVMARAQAHKKQSWRRTSPTPEREKALNWRLANATSNGLIGEIGLHQVDAASWFLNARPLSVTGFGGILHWSDGRDVPDTVQAVFEFPGSVNLTYDCTLGNSFDADYEMYYGSDAALMIRENKAWMFKEVDSPLLGWEVYARKDSFYKETGIALVANATKLTAQGSNPTADAAAEDPPLHYALEAFIANSDAVGTGVEDFAASFNVNDTKALREYLTGLAKNLSPFAGYKEGLIATITAIKANEAILTKQKITFKDEWFAL